MRGRAGDSDSSSGWGSSLGKLALQLSLTILVTWFILRAVGFNLQQLQDFNLSSLNINWFALALSCIVLFGAYLYAAGLWGIMASELGSEEVPVVAGFRVFFLANLGRYIPGKLWQIAGLAYLGQGIGVGAGVASGAAVLGQAFSLSGATLLGAGVLLGRGGMVLEGRVWALGLILVLILTAASPRILEKLLGVWFRMAGEAVPEEVIPGRTFGVRWTGLYVLGWMGQGLGFWILARGLGFELGILPAVSSYCAAYVGGYLALFAPAGVGVREGLLVALLGPVLGTAAAVLAVVARLWATAVELFAAMIFAGRHMRDSLKVGERDV